MTSIDPEKKNDKPPFVFMGKNKYFYINIIFAGIITAGTFYLNKFIATTSYIPLGIGLMTLVTIFLGKLKEYIDENDPSSALGKIKKENIEKSLEIELLKEKMRDKQARINSLILAIQESQSLKKLQSNIVKWYVNSDNECYAGNDQEVNIKDANEKASEEITKYLK